MKEAKWTFLQCYYVIKSSLQRMYGEQNRDFFKKEFENEKGLKKVFLLVALDSQIEKLVSEWYRQTNSDLEDIRKQYPSDVHFLNSLYKEIEDFKWQIHLKEKREVYGDLINL